MTTRFLALLRALWRNLVRRDRADAALDDELREYVDLVAAENERSGMAPELARRTALVDTGGIEQVKESTRDAWAGHAFDTFARELRYTVRSLRRSPAFLAIAVVTLALGIGGATAVFTVINASLLRSLPSVPESNRLVTVERMQGARMIAEFSYPDFRDLRDQATSIGLAAFNGTSMTLEVTGESRGAMDTSSSPGSRASPVPAELPRAWVSYVSDNFFAVLNVRPVMGRGFTVGDSSGTGAETAPVAVLGHATWQSRFAGSSSVIGSTIRLDGHVFTVIGVAPPGFIGGMTSNPMELWIPLATAGSPSPTLRGLDLTSRRSAWFRLVGRLGTGRSAEDAQRELAVIAAQLAATYPSNRDRSVRVLTTAGLTAHERAELSRVPRLLAMAVALLLLIACGNVATLSLVRASSRRRELATRLALGASRAVLVRQVALEGAAIAAASGVLGIVLARVLVQSSVLVSTVIAMPLYDLRLDSRVLGVALAASALTAVLVSLMPAMQLFRVPPGAVLKDGGGGAVGRRSAQRALVAAQVGASLVLLSAAAIVFSAFQRILVAHDGLDPSGLTMVFVDASRAEPDTVRQLAFFREVLARAAAEPAIDGATVTTSVPPLEWSMQATVFRSGEEPPPEVLAGRELELGVRVKFIVTSADFFDVMRIPILRGRAFGRSDNGRGEQVAIVSRGLANALWPRQDPIGRLLAWPSAEGPPRAPLRVAGVAADTRDVMLSGPPPLALYVPMAQHPGAPHILAVRARGSVPVAPGTIQRMVAGVNPAVVVLGEKTLLGQLQAEVRPQRMASAWIGVFGAIALLLAAIGVYGVVAQGVLQRTRELAVRSALGATPGGILATILADGMRLAALGAMLGGVGVVVAVRVLRSLFDGVQSVDVLSVGAAAAVLGAAILVAAIVPARRASRLNPVDALRCD